MRRIWLTLALAVPGCTTRSGIDVPARGVESTEVRVPGNTGPEQTIARSNDLDAISAFLGALRRAKESGDHKCASTARVLIRRKQEPTIDIELLPGHDPRFYEYRHDGHIYRTPRPGMLAALKRLGLTDPPLE